MDNIIGDALNTREGFSMNLALTEPIMNCHVGMRNWKRNNNNACQDLKSTFSPHHTGKVYKKDAICC